MEPRLETPATSSTTTPIPATTAPPGSFSDLSDPPNILWKFNVVAQTVCMTVAGTVFFLRCYVRLGFSRMPRQWVTEDWMIILSFLGLTVYSALMGVMMDHNGGVHLWNLTKEQAQKALYYFWIETIIYGPFIFFTKFSILLLYLRLLVPTRWSALWATIHVFIAISASFYIALTIVKIWQCEPQERAWNRTMEGRCINLPVLLQVSGLFNTISDALILLVPVKAVWKLKLTWQKKVAICAVFTIGAIAPIFSALGFYCRVRTARSNDATYNDPQILLWATAEITTGIICACLPALPPLVRGNRKPSTSTPTPQSRSQVAREMEGKGGVSRAGVCRFGAYIELEERSIQQEIVTSVGSANDVMGFKLKSIEDANRSHLGEVNIEEERSGIVKTVRIEQSTNC